MNLYKIPTHQDSPNHVNAVIEISKGTNAKYEYCPEMNMFKLDRCLASAMMYPANYGFVPKTLAADGDPLDVIVYNNTPVMPGCLVECKVIGALDMVDEGSLDYKVVCIPVGHSKCSIINDLNDIDPLFLKIAANFFKHYKDLNGKSVVVNGWLPAATAKEIVKESVT